MTLEWHQDPKSKNVWEIAHTDDGRYYYIFSSYMGRFKLCHGLNDIMVCTTIERAKKEAQKHNDAFIRSTKWKIYMENNDPPEEK